MPRTQAIFTLAESLGVNPHALREAFELSDTNPAMRSQILTLLNEADQASDALRRHIVSELRAATPQRTWRQIGHMLGVSGQAAHKRFSS